MKKLILLSAVIVSAVIFFAKFTPDTETISCIKIESKDISEKISTVGSVVSDGTVAYIYAEIPMSDTEKIEVGSSGEIRCASRTATAEVIGISPYKYSNTASLRLKCSDAANIMSQSYADITVYGKTHKNSLTVPFESVMHKNGKDYLWVLDGNFLKCTEVITGTNHGLETTIVSGLENGDIIAECPTWNFGESIRIKQ